MITMVHMPFPPILAFDFCGDCGTLIPRRLRSDCAHSPPSRFPKRTITQKCLYPDCNPGLQSIVTSSNIRAERLVYALYSACMRKRDVGMIRIDKKERGRRRCNMLQHRKQRLWEKCKRVITKYMLQFFWCLPHLFPCSVWLPTRRHNIFRTSPFFSPSFGFGWLRFF